MDKKQKGIIYIILAAFSFATMAFFIQLAKDVNFIQKSFSRNLIAMIFSSIVIFKNGGDFSYKKGNFKYLIMRSFFGSFGIFFNFYAVDHLILSDATMLAKLAPFFTIIFSYIILKEKIKLWQTAGIIIAFAGSLLIINPDFLIQLLFHGKIIGAFNNIPSLIGMLGAVASGIAYTTIRILASKGERGPIIVFFFSTFFVIITFPLMIKFYEPMSTKDIFYLIGLGLAATAGQFAITEAYSNAPAKEISIFDYSQILFSAMYGITFMGQIPSVYSLIGYTIIISSAVFMFVKSNRNSKNLKIAEQI